MLYKKVIEPPEGEDHLILNGEVNDCIRELLDGRYGNLFQVPEEASGVVLDNWKVERYTTLYDELMKIAEEHSLKIVLWYDQERKAVVLKAVAVENYADDLEYSQDGKVDFDIMDDRSGVNHLICGGQGEGKERMILHLYVQEDGSIGDEKYYDGIEEVVEFYDYSSAQDEETLRSEGEKRLKELQNYKKMEMFVDDIDLDIGDIVAGKEYITGTELQKPVVQKILRRENGESTIEYRLEGEE